MKRMIAVLTLIMILMGCISGCSGKGSTGRKNTADWYVEKMERILYNSDGTISHRNVRTYRGNGQLLKFDLKDILAEFSYEDDRLVSLTLRDPENSQQKLVFELNFSKKNGEYVAESKQNIEGELATVHVICNKDNQLLSFEYFVEQELLYREAFTYHDNGLMKTWTMEEPEYTYVDKFDSRGNILEEEVFEDGVSTERITFQYSNGMIIGKEYYMKDGDDLVETLEEREANKTRTVLKDKGGKVACYWEYEYDDNMNWLGLSRFTADNQLAFQTKYTWKEVD